MEIINLSKADGLPPVDWAAVAGKLAAGSAPAPDAVNSRTTWLSTVNEDGSPLRPDQAVRDQHDIGRVIAGWRELQATGDQVDVGVTGGERRVDRLAPDAVDRVEVLAADTRSGCCCSDGLHVAAPAAAIARVLLTVPDPDQATAGLIALAIDGGAPDNIACIVAGVGVGVPPGKTAGKIAGETAWTASTRDAILNKVRMSARQQFRERRISGRRGG